MNKKRISNSKDKNGLNVRRSGSGKLSKRLSVIHHPNSNINRSSRRVRTSSTSSDVLVTLTSSQRMREKRNRQRQAVRDFRLRERERLEQTLATIRRMREETELLNRAIDAMDQDMDLLRELIELQKCAKKSREKEEQLSQSLSQSSSQSSAAPAIIQKPVEDQQSSQRSEHVFDLTDLISSQSELQTFTEIIRHDRESV